MDHEPTLHVAHYSSRTSARQLEIGWYNQPLPPQREQKFAYNRIDTYSRYVLAIPPHSAPTRATITELQNAWSISRVMTLEERVVFIANRGQQWALDHRILWSDHGPCYSEATSLTEYFIECQPRQGSIPGVAPCWVVFFFLASKYSICIESKEDMWCYLPNI